VQVFFLLGFLCPRLKVERSEDGKDVMRSKITISSYCHSSFSGYNQLMSWVLKGPKEEDKP
jgi:hypothetical protein